MDESTEETQARQATAISGEIDQEVGENGVLVSGGGAGARVLRGQEAPDAGAFRTPVAGGDFSESRRFQFCMRLLKWRANFSP